MSTSQIEIQLIGALTAVACALPGTILILRRTSARADATRHATLLAVVLAVFAVANLGAPPLIVGAALAGLLAVGLVGALAQAGRLREETATGLALQLLLGLAALLASRYAGGLHLGLDTLLLGDLAGATRGRVGQGGTDLGPRALWAMLGLTALNGALVALLPLGRRTGADAGDAGPSVQLGLSPGLVDALAAASVVVTTVGVLPTAGAILIVSLMVGPPTTAAALARTRGTPGGTIRLSVAVGMGTAVAGYWLSRALDVSIAGSTAAVAGLVFVLSLLAATLRSARRGGIPAPARRLARSRERAETMLDAPL